MRRFLYFFDFYCSWTAGLTTEYYIKDCIYCTCLRGARPNYGTYVLLLRRTAILVCNVHKCAIQYFRGRMSKLCNFILGMRHCHVCLLFFCVISKNYDESAKQREEWLTTLAIPLPRCGFLSACKVTARNHALKSQMWLNVRTKLVTPTIYSAIDRFAVAVVVKDSNVVGDILIEYSRIFWSKVPQQHHNFARSGDVNVSLM